MFGREGEYDRVTLCLAGKRKNTMDEKLRKNKSVKKRENSDNSLNYLVEKMEGWREK